MTPDRTGEQRAIERRAARVRRVPSLFLAHGSPMTLVDKAYGAALRKFIGRQKRLRAVIAVSAHWQTAGALRITSSPQPRLIYDFAGFPDWLYQVSYPCPGDRAIAQTVAILLQRQGLAAVLDPERGLDHGVWVPLSLAIPDASLPVIQVSLPDSPDPVGLVAIGEALAPLRSEDVLLVGTGGIVHNLRRISMDAADDVAEPWASDFDAWVGDRAAALDVAALSDYQAAGPHAAQAAPTSEHFDPLLVTMGSVLPNDSVMDIYTGFRYGTLSLRSFALVGRRREDRGF